MEGILNFFSSHPLITGVFIIVILFILTYNNLNAKKHNVEKAFSNIDTYLEQRFDQMTSLLDQVERDWSAQGKIYTDVTKLRSGIVAAKESDDINTKIKAANLISSPRLLAESYPQLGDFSGNSLFAMQSNVDIEKQLNAARRQYNNNVTSFNTAITAFPTSIVAGLTGFKEPYELFIASDAKREPPKVKKTIEY